MTSSSGPEPVLERSKTPPIPSGTKPLSHQVAGHVFGRANGHKVNKIGFLQLADGSVLKPALGPTKGDREVHFYEKLFSEDCQDQVLLDLRQFVAKFLGVWTTPEHPGVLYLKLENVTRQFEHPCLMDVKVGAITYDHEADDEKIAREKAKSPALPHVKFQIVGIRFVLKVATFGLDASFWSKRYDSSTGSYQVLDRRLVRSLDAETVLTKGLALYFRADDSFDTGLVNTFLRHLHSIESWFNAQSSYHFIASSLLFIYDGDAVRTPVNGPPLPLHSGSTDHSATGGVNGCLTADGSDSYWEGRVELKMIDFTHAYSVSSRDENYLAGLRSMIDYVHRLKPWMYKPDL